MTLAQRVAVRDKLDTMVIQTGSGEYNLLFARQPRRVVALEVARFRTIAYQFIRIWHNLEVRVVRPRDGHGNFAATRNVELNVTQVVMYAVCPAGSLGTFWSGKVTPSCASAVRDSLEHKYSKTVRE